MTLQLAATASAHTDEECGGIAKGGTLHHFPMRHRGNQVKHHAPALRAVETEKETDATSNPTHHPDMRKDLGVGHHHAQRAWEIEQGVREKLKLPKGITATSQQEFAGETFLLRPDGIAATILLTHNAIEQMRKERLSVPKDIPEDAY